MNAFAWVAVALIVFVVAQHRNPVVETPESPVSPIGPSGATVFSVPQPATGTDVPPPVQALQGNSASDRSLAAWLPRPSTTLSGSTVAAIDTAIAASSSSQPVRGSMVAAPSQFIPLASGPKPIAINPTFDINADAFTLPNGLQYNFKPGTSLADKLKFPDVQRWAQQTGQLGTIQGASILQTPDALPAVRPSGVFWRGPITSPPTIPGPPTVITGGPILNPLPIINSPVVPPVPVVFDPGGGAQLDLSGLGNGMGIHRIAVRDDEQFGHIPFDNGHSNDFGPFLGGARRIKIS